MAGDSKIEWTDSTWNPIVGCSIVSPGCTNCYAMKMAARIEKMSEAIYDAGKATPPAQYNGTTKIVNGQAVWTGVVRQAPDHVLLAPLHWKKPRRIFVNSMGDLFHESIPDEWIDKVFAAMALSPHHTFQVLTKRAERMRAYVRPSKAFAISNEINKLNDGKSCLSPWPLPNVWLGVSCERQQEADERIPHLLNTPAAIRFVSAEPLLGAIDFTPKANATYQRLSEWYGPNGFDPEGNQPRRDRMSGLFPRLDWIIVGGESGPRARPMHPQWARDIRDQCAAAGVAFFFKQWGEWASKIDRDVDDPDWRLNYTVSKADPRRYQICNLAGGQGFHGDRVQLMERVGKKSAGRLLDGKEHNAFPHPRPSSLEATSMSETSRSLRKGERAVAGTDGVK